MDIAFHPMAQPYKLMIMEGGEVLKGMLDSFWEQHGLKLMKETPGSWTKISALRSHLEKKEGSKLYMDIVWDLIEQGIQKSNLEVAGIGSIAIDRLDEKRGAMFTVVVDLVPKVKLCDYKNIILNAPAFKPTEKEIEGQIFLALNHSPLAKTEELQGDIQATDTIKVSYSYSIMGEDKPLAAESHVLINLAAGNYAKEFVECVVGEPAPSKFTKTVVFGPDAHKKLQNKTVSFSFDVDCIVKRTIPTLEEYVVSEGTTAEALKDKIKNEIEINKKESFGIRKRDFIREQVENVLSQSCEYDPIPDSLLDKETESLAQMAAGSRNMTIDEYCKAIGVTSDELHRGLAPSAMRKIRIKLAVKAIADVEGLVCNEDSKNKFFDFVATEQKKNIEDVKKDLEGKPIDDIVRMYLVDQFLADNVKILPNPQDLEKPTVEEIPQIQS